MSDQYQDTPQYIVYFVLGAAVGVFVVYELTDMRLLDVVRWQHWTAGALIGGFLAVFFGDRFWEAVKKVFNSFWGP